MSKLLYHLSSHQFDRFKQTKVDLGNTLNLSEGRLGSWSIDKILMSIFEANDGAGMSFLDDEEIDNYDDDIIETPSGENLKDLYWDEEKQASEFVEWLKSKNIDSIRYKNTYEGGGDSYIVFDPNRISIEGVETYQIEE